MEFKFEPQEVEFSFLGSYKVLMPYQIQFAACMCGVRARVHSVMDADTQDPSPFMFYNHNAPCGIPCARSQSTRHIDQTHNAVECPKCGVLNPESKLEIERLKTLRVELKP